MQALEITYPRRVEGCSNHDRMMIKGIREELQDFNLNNVWKESQLGDDRMNAKEECQVKTSQWVCKYIHL